ncbi:unnamed protein product [Ostreobium quekettii]|uniref:Uncharacterized protein n=1 Tax=Ostreobium quekettii TaxID=121088 RepID=A0A8S1JAX1_9CHLO|nr:unnamed protein product [Ostreobium quekettii]
MPSRRDCTDMSQEWWTALRHSTCSSECYDFSDDDLEGQHQVIHMLNQDATSVVGSCVQQEGNHQYEWSTRRRMVNKLRKPVVVLQDSPAGSATRGSGHAQRSRKTCHDSNQQKTCCPQCQQSCRRLALQCHKQQKQISSQALRLGGQTAAVRAMEEALQSKDAALAMLQQALDDKTVALARMRAAQRLKPRQRTRSMTAMKSALGKESELATKVKLLESQARRQRLCTTACPSFRHSSVRSANKELPQKGNCGKNGSCLLHCVST